MPIALPALMLQHSEAPHGRSPWVWLWELEIQRATKTVPAVVFRFTTRTEETSWPPGAPTPATYYPFPFEQSPIEQTNEADLPAIDLTIDNTARVLMPFLHAGDGCEGNAATLILTTEAALTSPTYPNHEQMEWQFVVASAIAGNAAIQFRLEQPNLFQRRLPADRFVARRCRWRFGSDECGYPLNAFAGVTTCDKTLTTCIEVGQDEAARRLPVLHPRRYGGFPGIPILRRTV